MASIKEFIADSRSKGLSRGNRFTLYFNAPNSLSSFALGTVRNISLYCSGANVPGLSLSTVPIRTTGEVREMPYDRNFQEMHVTFYADSSLQAKYFFDEWINSVQDRDTRLFNYFDDYSIPVMTVEVEDLQGNTVYRVDLIDVYPKSVDAIPLHHANTNFIEVSVSFVYRYWESSQFVNGRIVSGPPPLGATTDPFISLPGSIGSFLPGASDALNSVTSVFTPAISAVDSSLGGFANQVAGFNNIIPANLVDAGNSSTIASLSAQFSSTRGVLANVTAQLASPAGLNIGATGLSQISAQISGVKDLTTSSSSLGTSISMFTASSVPGITSQLSNIQGNLNVVTSAVSNLQTTVNTNIGSAAVSLLSSTGIAPNATR